MDIINYFEKPIIGKALRLWTINKEGGDKVSGTLRRYTAEKCHVSVGLYSYGGCFDPGFNVGGNVTIGNYCSFGQDIRYFGANHPINYATMSPYFYNEKWGGFKVTDVKRESLAIGNDVWCGYGTIITSKCHSIGNGAVIGAGSVVTRDVPAYSIVMGVPAKIVRSRFDEKTISKLEESRWWELTPDQLMKYYSYISDPIVWAEMIISGRNQ